MADKPRFGTVGFYEEVAKQLNDDATWREMSVPITYTMTFHYEEPVDKYFFLNFEAGEITEVMELGRPEERHVDFLIAGQPAVWQAVIQGRISPPTAMATAKFKIAGKQTILLRHMKKFSYLINKMTEIDAVFP
jgi:putative sterol carrier protein